MDEPETVVALFVGGPLHGTTRELPADTTVWVEIPRVVGGGLETHTYTRRGFGGVPDINPDSFKTYGVMLDAPNRPRYRRDVWLYDETAPTAARALVRNAVFRAWLRGGTPVEPSAEL